MLKINVPFRKKEEVLPLIAAGADELYCGYLAPDWKERFTGFEFERKGGSSNFTDLDELREAVELAHAKNVAVYLAINGLYVHNQYGLLRKTLRELETVDLDGYIIADIGLLLTLRQIGFKKRIHISTGFTVFNSEAVQFFKELGAERIVLDRQTSLESMRKISCDFSDIEFEVFILNTLCVYIDGFCTFLHTYGRDEHERINPSGRNKTGVHFLTAYDPRAQADACSLKYAVSAWSSDLHEKVGSGRKIRPTFFKQLTDSIECGACAIYDICQTDIYSIKIVGRQYNPEKRLTDIKFIHQALEIIGDNKGISKEDFTARVQKIYQKTYNYHKQCRGNNCYYF